MLNLNFHVNLIGNLFQSQFWLRLQISHGKWSSTQKVTENLTRELVLRTLIRGGLRASIEVGPMAVICLIILYFS